MYGRKSRRQVGWKESKKAGYVEGKQVFMLDGRKSRVQDGGKEGKKERWMFGRKNEGQVIDKEHHWKIFKLKESTHTLGHKHLLS